MARTQIPLVSDGSLFLLDGAENRLSPVLVGSAAWYTWLTDEQNHSFSFRNHLGTFTARKERQRQGWYWYAYRKYEGKLSKAYLGKSETLTIEHLHAAAAVLTGKGNLADDPQRDAGAALKGNNPPLLSSVALSRSTQHDQAPIGAKVYFFNLPVQLTSLVGRDRETTVACMLLRRPGVCLLTLTGTGGVGKTRLGLQMAHELGENFANGICFVSLAPLSDPNLVMPAIAQALGLTEKADQSPLEQLKTYLQDKHLLLFLDNFEQVAEAAAPLVELLQTCPHLKALVTSRALLHVRGAYEFFVPPLALPDLKHLPNSEVLSQNESVALFVQRAQAIKNGFEINDINAIFIAEVCVQLDGLPLAIELAAARIRLFSPQKLLERLEHRLQVLTGGADDLPERQQTLRNTLQWSYDLLDPDEQYLFRWLSLFAGGCTLEAIEAIAHTLGERKTQVLDGVTSLLNNHLLYQQEQTDGESRLMMLETIHEYGLEALAESGEMEESQQAHAAYYLTLAERSEQELRSGQQQEWLVLLQREVENLRAALKWARDNRKIALGLRLAGALGIFWYMRGYLNEGRTWLEELLSCDSSGGNPVSTDIRAKALNSASMLVTELGDYGQAALLVEESMGLFQELGDKRGRAAALNTRGIVAKLQGNYAYSATLYEESLSLQRELNNKRGIAAALNNLAAIAQERGNYKRALELGEESLAIKRESGNKHGIAQSLVNLGDLALKQGDAARASQLVEESLQLFRELEDTRGIALALNNLGEVERDRGSYAHAAEALETSIALYRELGNKWGIALALCSLGDVILQIGELDRAKAIYKESLALYQVENNTVGVIACLNGLAGVAAAQGEPLLAARVWGMVETQRSAVGVPISLVEHAHYERLVTTARVLLGEKTFASAWAEGCSMTLEQTFALLERITIPTGLISTVPQSPAVIKSSLSPTYPNDLTTREVEVLQLLSAGLTSAQIAAQLVISLLTVNTHVRSIYSKLGVTSRSAATRYAIEHKLV
ncbi:MAG TPA: tetratricopeptide repeat protein [Ktedonobacteraceae bacterium]|nr:tetratricopeptide repeat protein [Ktedonobacteraceae bacterium]